MGLGIDWPWKKIPKKLPWWSPTIGVLLVAALGGVIPSLIAKAALPVAHAGEVAARGIASAPLPVQEPGSRDVPTPPVVPPLLPAMRGQIRFASIGGAFDFTLRPDGAVWMGGTDAHSEPFAGSGRLTPEQAAEVARLLGELESGGAVPLGPTSVAMTLVVETANGTRTYGTSRQVEEVIKILAVAAADDGREMPGAENPPQRRSPREAREGLLDCFRRIF